MTESKLTKDFFCSFNGSEEQHERLVAGKGMNDLHGDRTFDTLVMTGTVIKMRKGNVKSVLRHEWYQGDTRSVLHSLVKEIAMK